MSTQIPGQEKATDETISNDERRATYEQFSFRVPAPGFVNVANHSYGEEEAGEHCYSVEFIDGEAIGCSCPHWQHRSPSGGCKHMRAVESEPAIVRALAHAEAREGAGQ
jgi:hypothetical protein